MLPIFLAILIFNFIPGMRYNFRKHGSNIDSMNVPYDYLSVMHYGRTAFGSGKTTIETLDKTKQYLIGQRGGLSQLDILQMNLLYKCPGISTVLIVFLLSTPYYLNLNFSLFWGFYQP